MLRTNKTLQRCYTRLFDTWLLCGSLFGVLSFFAASHAAEPTLPPPASAEDLDFFERKIRPLLIQRCNECHSEKAKSVKGGLRLDDRTALWTGGDSGPAVVAREPDKSLLIQAVRYSSDVATMPPTGKLPAAEIELLVEWVRRGAPFPESTAKATTQKKSIDFAAGKQHWAFQPLRSMPLPIAQAAHSRDWPRRRVDHFVLRELEKNSLAPSHAAAPRELIRRVAFDLTGLPPTPDDVEWFVARCETPDGALAAYESLVDRYLASPHYGERWGRMWLDLVRYCDVPESWAVEKFAQPWLYRDWVAAAWNRDEPYDRFLTLQLAADLLPDHAPADIAALGFLGLSPNYWKELQLDPAVIKGVVAEEWEERIHTLTGSLLGLTVACARCHDHKFDPVSMEDYYALAGVLASSRVTARSVLPAEETQAVQAARAEIEKLEKERQTLLGKKPPTDDDKRRADELQREITALKSRPGLESAFAYALDDASLHVLPNGPNHTKLDYRANQPLDVALQIRGNATNLGPIVPRRYLTVLSAASPAPFRQGSGRLELAQSITRDSSGLAARVLVNRIWKQVFGQPLVDTPSNFGLQGSRPTHPELLEDLADQFVAHGWSLKWLHRELVLSATYQQASHAAQSTPDQKRQWDRAKGIDPDNRWLWRAHRKRLDVEAWRDAMLAATGDLDGRIGGPPLAIDDANHRRRTFYSLIRRRELHDLLRLYDFPDPMTHSAAREATTTPLQQLFVLNSPFVQQRATALANRARSAALNDPAAQIRAAYRWLYGREPTLRQQQAGEAFLQSLLTASPNQKPAALDAAWLRYAQVLLASNEVLFVD